MYNLDITEHYNDNCIRKGHIKLYMFWNELFFYQNKRFNSFLIIYRKSFVIFFLLLWYLS